MVDARLLNALTSCQQLNACLAVVFRTEGLSSQMRIIIICSEEHTAMSFDTPHHSLPAAEPAVPVSESTPRRLFTEQLIGPAREVLIRHAGRDYRLRITRQGKLILTK